MSKVKKPSRSPKSPESDAAAEDTGADGESTEPQSGSGNAKWAHLPSTKLALRAKEGAQLLIGPFNSSFVRPTKYIPNVIADTLFSTDGRLWAVPTIEGVKVYDTTQPINEPLFVLPRKNVMLLSFSPRGTYLVTYEEAKTGTDLAVFSTAFSTANNNRHVCSFAVAKLQTPKASWPVLRWDDNELIMCRLVSSGVEIYGGDLMAAANAKSASSSTDDTAAAAAAAPDPGAEASDEKKSTPSASTTQYKPKILNKLAVDNVQFFTIAPKISPLMIGTFVPTKKDMPSKITLFEYNPSSPTTAAAIKATKSFFSEEVEMRWHPQGTAVLVQSMSEVDKTNKNYYGESGLYVLGCDGKIAAAVEKSAGTVCDAQWNPNGKEFVVIQGTQPARVRAYNIKAEPHFEFGTISRNTIRWSPHGRFLMLGGFASLPGDMDFWDRNKKKVILPAKDIHSPKTFQWFPDSRSFVTATIRPRRVDNSFKVWSYAGELLYSSDKFDELNQILVCPSPDGVYPDRPQSPRISDKRAGAVVAPVAAAAPKAYIPPHRRHGAAAQGNGSSPSGRGGGGGSGGGVGGGRGSGTTSDIMKVHKQNTGPRSLTALSKQVVATGATGSDGPYVPGSQLLNTKLTNTANAEKNKKRRDRKKAQKAREVEGGDDEGGDGGEGEESTAASSAAAVGAEDDGDAKAGGGSALDEKAKKIRALNKRLRAIDQLKAKAASGEALEDAFKKKLAEESKLRAELAALQAS